MDVDNRYRDNEHRDRRSSSHGTLRSFLYVPGDRSDRIAKAFAAGADAVLVDLEDSVAPSVKAEARNAARAALRNRSAEGPAFWLRINAGDIGRADLAALADGADALENLDNLDGLVLAKCDDPGWVDEVASVMPAHVALSPLIETALGVRRLDALCVHPRVAQCHLGEIDLLADLGAHSSSGPELLGLARAELVYSAAAAAIMPPIGGVHADVRDLETLARESEQLAHLGFAGRPAIHPSQVSVINAAFRPTADEIAAASRLVDIYDAALGRGEGAVTDADGRMIDEAVVRRARRLVASQPTDAGGRFDE